MDSDSDNSESLGDLGMDTVPSDYDESDESDDIELPATNQTRGIEPAATTSGLRFRSNHFTRGNHAAEVLTSSSDEEGISTGLDFKNVGLDQCDSRVNAVLATVAKDSGELLGNLMNSEVVATPNQSDSSIDSEFEIIDHE